MGQDSDTIAVVTDQDTESSFDYSPSSQWSTDVPNAGMFSGGSGQCVDYSSLFPLICIAQIFVISVTYTAGASVRFTFKVSDFFLLVISFTNHPTG